MPSRHWVGGGNCSGTSTLDLYCEKTVYVSKLEVHFDEMLGSASGCHWFSKRSYHLKGLGPYTVSNALLQSQYLIWNMQKVSILRSKTCSHFGKKCLWQGYLWRGNPSYNLTCYLIYRCIRFWDDFAISIMGEMQLKTSCMVLSFIWHKTQVREDLKNNNNNESMHAKQNNDSLPELWNNSMWLNRSWQKRGCKVTEENGTRGGKHKWQCVILIKPLKTKKKFKKDIKAFFWRNQLSECFWPLFRFNQSPIIYKIFFFIVLWTWMNDFIEIYCALHVSIVIGLYQPICFLKVSIQWYTCKLCKVQSDRWCHSFAIQ